jgi:chromosome segregation ATPase
MSEQLSKLEKNVGDILEIVVSMKGYIENNLVTKEELSKELNSLEKKLEKRMDTGFEEVNGKIDGLNRRIDNEAENRAQIETRVRKVEEAVFPV